MHGNFDAGGVIIARKKPPDMTSSEPRETSLFLQQIRVHGKLKLGVAGPHQPDGTGAICPVLVGHVELRQAFVRRFECAECLLHLPNNKPPVKFVLHGFGFRDLNDTLVNHITAWVEDSSLPPFAPHTYDHCATVLRRLGRTDEANAHLAAALKLALAELGERRA